MDWTQAFTIIGVLGAFTFWLFTKVDADIKQQGQRVDQQMQRIDQLYQMFIDLLKDRNKNTP
jgi:hypothetical protein